MLRKRFKRLFVDNMKMTGFYGYVYDFSVDYDAIAADFILNIHKYFMKKEWHSINKMFRFIKKIFIAAMAFVGCVALVS